MDKYRAAANESEIPPNLLGLTDASAIGLAEFEGFLRADILVTEALMPATQFTLPYLLEMHRLALGHLYAFAGRYREVNISKGGFAFPAARFLPASMQQFERDWLHQRSPADSNALLDRVGAVHGELLFIHSFREGNGRTARLLANPSCGLCARLVEGVHKDEQDEFEDESFGRHGMYFLGKAGRQLAETVFVWLVGPGAVLLAGRLRAVCWRLPVASSKRSSPA